jgi:transcription antitermination factor NusG
MLEEIKSTENQNSVSPLQWFAAKTRPHQELKIKNKLDELGVENFLPMKEQLRVVGEKKRKVLRPLVPRLLFLHCRKEALFKLLNEHFLPLSYLRDLETKQVLVIPDRQMRDFIFFVDFARDSIQVLNDKLKPGDRVRVVKGELAGLEGELIRIKGHKRVVIRLQGLFSVAAGTYLPKHYLEPLDPKQ